MIKRGSSCILLRGSSCNVQGETCYILCLLLLLTVNYGLLCFVGMIMPFAYGFMVLSSKCQRGSLLVIFSWLFFGNQNIVNRIHLCSRISRRIVQQLHECGNKDHPDSHMDRSDVMQFKSSSTKTRVPRSQTVRTERWTVRTCCSSSTKSRVPRSKPVCIPFAARPDAFERAAPKDWRKRCCPRTVRTANCPIRTARVKSHFPRVF
jgi:hypothetical protein